MRDKALWDRLSSYGFPLTGDRGSLRHHLASETRLTSDQADRVVNEYRRFLYLAAASGRMVVPSPLIDRVWHTHIEDTRAYLDDFCQKVIGRVIHHSPGRKRAFDDPGYFDTLRLYRDTFGEEPFARVWPVPEALRWRKWGMVILLAGVLGSVVAAFATDFPWPFIVWPILFALGVWAEQRWGAWSIQPKKDGSGCSSCGSGDDGGCGGD